MPLLRFVNIFAALAMVTSAVVVAAASTAAATAAANTLTPPLPCPHNTCTFCSDSCPSPSTWGICFPSPSGWYCGCETVSYSTGFCSACEHKGNWFGDYSEYDNAWYDWIGTGCEFSSPCLTFSMRICS